jgi:hypothetical protein
MMSHNLTQHLLHALRLAPAFVFPLLVAMPNQYALADGEGCSWFGIDGMICIGIKGNGLRVNTAGGSFAKPTELCNWRIDIAYTDTNGNNYNTVRGPTNSGCIGKGDFGVTYTPYKSVREGRVCAQLYESGSYVDAACVHLSNSSNNPLPRD